MSEQDTEITLSGRVERIVFENKLNGYVVFSLSPDAQSRVLVEEIRNKFEVRRSGVSCVGIFVDPRLGMDVRLTGNWVRHPKYGQQFAFTRSEEIFPTTMDGIKAYLTSGVIQGMGEKLAERIANTFGEDTLTVLDKNPERLLEIEGLGKKTFAKIRSSWEEHTVHRNLTLFLQPFGITPGQSARIVRTLGEDALSRIKENPYCLARDVRGISFTTADMIASKLDFPKDHPYRLKGALLAVLEQVVDDGNVYIPSDEAYARVCRFCSIDKDAFEQIITELSEEKRIVAEEWNNGEALYLANFYTYETSVANRIVQILQAAKSTVFPNPKASAEAVISGLSFTLAPEQREAVLMSAESKIMVLTGGPGTGKTTIIRAIIALFDSVEAKIQLAAPTGRAARRMHEATGRDAVTIHRLLEFAETTELLCTWNEKNPLKCDVLIVDEASMIDIVLFFHLLAAVPLGCTVILVGDVFQLPSVGPGSVLHDVISSGVVPVVELTRIFRQSQESAIVRYAHLINEGIVPDFSHDTEKKTDFYFMEENDPDAAAKTVTDLVKRRLPEYYHFSFNDIQVLSPMRPGAIGITALNSALQEALNPNGQSFRRGQQTFRVNDRVMQVRNNYSKEVFNGDIGTIVAYDQKESLISVRFDDELVFYTLEEAEELVVAYATSIHKSQGSEYPCVIVPLMMCHSWMLQRNLLYTAITRGKKLVVLIGERAALNLAVRNIKTVTRLTRLAERLSACAAAL